MRFRVVVLFLSMLMFSISCQQEQLVIQKHGRISFVVNQSTQSGGRVANETPSSLLLSVENSEGKSIYENKKLSLMPFGQKYLTEDIELTTGNYHITKFLVLANDKVLYATPLKGSTKASLVNTPLPIAFQVEENKSSTVAPEVVSVVPTDTPQGFGYSSFGFTIADNDSTAYMNVRVKFEPTVGGIFYPNVDADFTVTAFDADHNEKWKQTLPYHGPLSNDLSIKKGFYSYSIEVSKWGITSKQNFIGSDLWEGRVRDGQVPITRVFSGSVAAKKLSQYITSFERIENGTSTFVPDSKVTYSYNSQNKITMMNVSRYDKTTALYIKESQSVFEYANDRVSKIITHLAGTGTPHEEISYQYDEIGQAVQITNKSFASSITTQVALTYNANERLITAVYSLSNGRSFVYESTNEWGNLKTDRTTNGAQLCSEGVYVYDKNINPLKHTGYVDYLLRNYSNGNKLTETVNYTGCGFPSLVPESYSYTYDEDGYPTVATTTYKGKTAKSQVQYSY